MFLPELLFDKFKDYFNQKFDSISNINKQGEDSGFKDLKNKIEAKPLKRSGNTAQFEFCVQLEIAHDKIKIALRKKGDTQEAIDAIQEAEDLVTDRKRKIKIADDSKAGRATVQHLDKGGAEQSAEERKRVLVAEESALKEIESKKRQRRFQTAHSSSRMRFKLIVIFFEVKLIPVTLMSFVSVQKLI